MSRSDDRIDVVGDKIDTVDWPIDVYSIPLLPPSVEARKLKYSLVDSLVPVPRGDHKSQF